MVLLQGIWVACLSNLLGALILLQSFRLRIIFGSRARVSNLVGVWNARPVAMDIGEGSWLILSLGRISPAKVGF